MGAQVILVAFPACSMAAAAYLAWLRHRQGDERKEACGEEKEREGGSTDVRGQQRSERKKTHAVWLTGGPALQRGEGREQRALKAEQCAVKAKRAAAVRCRARAGEAEAGRG